MNVDTHGFNGLPIPRVHYIKNGKILKENNRANLK